MVILGILVFLLATNEHQCQGDLETTTTQTIDRECQGRQRFNKTIYPMLHSGWILIQRRGQYGNPAHFFSSKLWDDYEQGFGQPEKGSVSILHIQLLEYFKTSPSPSPPPPPPPSLSHSGYPPSISGTKFGIIDPLVSKRPGKNFE